MLLPEGAREAPSLFSLAQPCAAPSVAGYRNLPGFLPVVLGSFGLLQVLNPRLPMTQGVS